MNKKNKDPENSRGKKKLGKPSKEPFNYTLPVPAAGQEMRQNSEDANPAVAAIPRDFINILFNSIYFLLLFTNLFVFLKSLTIA